MKDRFDSSNEALTLEWDLRNTKIGLGEAIFSFESA
jgi:hypothetical protein